MEISEVQVEFGWNQSKKQIVITNNTKSTIIFKIKTTQIKILKATPSRGYIEDKQKRIIQIQCNNTKIKFQAKLQIVSAQISLKIDDFDINWTKRDQTTENTNIIMLRRKQNLQAIMQQKTQSNGNSLSQKWDDNNSQKSISSMTNSVHYSTVNNPSQIASKQIPIKEEKEKLKITKTLKGQVMMRSVTSPLKVEHKKSQPNKMQKRHESMFETTIVEEQQMDLNNNNLNQSLRYFQNTKAAARNGQTLQPAHYKAMNPNQLAEICFIQSQLLHQKQENKQLKQQIRTNRQRERTRQERMRQYQVNRSFASDSSNESVNLPIIALIASIFFIIGLLVSNL